MPLILRSAKGSPLLNDEIDDNFVYLDGKADTAQQAAEEAQGEAESAGEALSTHKGSGDHDARYLRKDVTQSAPLLTGIPQSGVVDLPYDLAQLRVALNTLMYPDGLIPSADFIFGGGQKTLDPRIVFTRNTPATYWEDGVLKTAAAGEPVFEDGAWRMEPSMTNKITARKHNPIDFSNTSTIPESSDPAAVYSISDDALALEESGLGNVCTNGMVYKIDNSGGTGKAYFQFYGATGSLNTHTISGYMRGSGSASIRLGNMPITNEPLTDRYVRRSVTQVPPSQSSTTVVEVAPGAVCYVILPQMEASTILTSVVPGNTLSAVTRSADNASITGEAFSEIWGASEGAVIVDIEQYLVSSSYGDVVIMPAEATSPRIAVVVASVDQPSIVWSPDGRRHIGSKPFGTRMKFGFAYSKGSAVAYINGQEMTPFSVDPDFDWSTMARMFIRTYGGLIRLYGVRFYKERPSSAQMEALTS